MTADDVLWDFAGRNIAKTTVRDAFLSRGEATKNLRVVLVVLLHHGHRIEIVEIRIGIGKLQTIARDLANLGKLSITAFQSRHHPRNEEP